MSCEPSMKVICDYPPVFAVVVVVPPSVPVPFQTSLAVLTQWLKRPPPIDLPQNTHNYCLELCKGNTRGATVAEW